MSDVAASLFNPAMRTWKEQGGNIVGYFCSMVPEELIMAAGLLPFRMRAIGSPGTDAADLYFTSMNCSFPRHCFSLALNGEFDFLDGVLCINSCDQIRRMYDNWRLKIGTPLIEFIALPRHSGPDQIKWYTEEFHRFKDRLESHFGVEITNGAIWDAIKLSNETRRMQRSLYELRKQDNPPITGAETLIVMIAGTAMPKAAYNELLRELIPELQAGVGVDSYRARLMVTGGILDDPEWVAAIEAVGGLVVTDGTCFGTRLMWVDVDETMSDPIGALAKYYLADRPSCPRMIDTQEKRSDYTINMAREFNYQWQVEQYLLTTDLRQAGIPLLKLDREYIASGIGQLKTRVQAFIEAMGK
jgi:benzoyl-CoA reductase/2-hydroxyglutaryl-CoA dehydratase subunit BcrC/BadD/HgdB